MYLCDEGSMVARCVSNGKEIWEKVGVNEWMKERKRNG
jgi:hypothetical protein